VRSGFWGPREFLGYDALWCPLVLECVQGGFGILGAYVSSVFMWPGGGLWRLVGFCDVSGCSCRNLACWGVRASLVARVSRRRGRGRGGSGSRGAQRGRGERVGRVGRVGREARGRAADL
jgi:hypothetical protein